MKPICVRCHRFFRMKKSGVYFIEGMPTGDGRAKPGLEESDKWRPYKLWAGDRWECNGCGATIISGVGLKPIAEHYQESFSADVRLFGANFQVNDC